MYVLDLTGPTPAGQRLVGLRALAAMPDWGIERDAGSPVDAADMRRLLCEPVNVVERAGPARQPVPAQVCDVDGIGDPEPVTVCAPLECCTGDRPWLPFGFSASFDRDACVDPDGTEARNLVAASVVADAELAVLEQLYTGFYDPRSASFGSVAVEVTDPGVPVTVSQGWEMLTKQMIHAGHSDWVTFAPPWLTREMTGESIISHGLSTVDINGQPVVSMWAPTDPAWTPGFDNAGGEPVPAEPGQAWLIAATDAWYWLDSPKPVVFDNHGNEYLQNRRSGYASVRGFVATGQRTLYAARVQSCEGC